jgi:hypothetical protein
MADFGIKVTSKDKDLKTAGIQDQLLNTKWPFAKMDVTNPASFKNIRIVFNNDLPGSGAGVRTTVKQYAHNMKDPKGNKLIPKFWVLGTNSNSSAGAFKYLGADGQVAATTVDSSVQIDVWVDNTNVYIDFIKYYDPATGDPNPTMVGTILNLRVYVFVEDLGV